MIQDVVIKKIERFEDGRGWLAEFYREDEIDYRPVMAYASMTKPGAIRGPHEHAKQSDYFVFIGPGDFTLHLWDRRESSKTKGEYLKIEAGESNPVLVIIPPGVVHGYKCISKEEAFCINLANKLYKGERKKEEADEVRWEQKPDSLYKIE